MLKASLTIFFGILFQTFCLAQFSPPGLGKTNAAAWFAVGIKEKLSSKKDIESETFIGIGTISNPDNNNLFQNPSIYVINEEIKHHFKPNWEYSIAASYRWQNKYKTTPSFELDAPNARQEIRFYSRFAYTNSFRKIKYSLSYRPEIRFFYNPDFKIPTENTEFRSRFRGKIDLNLNTAKTKKIITSAELLFATSKTTQWSPLKYKESRFCLYYSVAIPKQKLTFNIGYMNNVLGKKINKFVHYFAFDIVIKNPFEKR
jgi:hypothetical protein